MVLMEEEEEVGESKAPKHGGGGPTKMTRECVGVEVAKLFPVAKM